MLSIHVYESDAKADGMVDLVRLLWTNYGILGQQLRFVRAEPENRRFLFELQEPQTLKELTVSNYLKAKEIVENYRICGNGLHGCGKLFKFADTIQTIQYGQKYDWCKECFEEIKSEW